MYKVVVAVVLAIVAFVGVIFGTDLPTLMRGISEPSPAVSAKMKTLETELAELGKVWRASVENSMNLRKDRDRLSDELRLANQARETSQEQNKRLKGQLRSISIAREKDGEREKHVAEKHAEALVAKDAEIAAIRQQLTIAKVEADDAFASRAKIALADAEIRRLRLKVGQQSYLRRHAEAEAKAKDELIIANTRTEESLRTNERELTRDVSEWKGQAEKFEISLLEEAAKTKRFVAKTCSCARKRPRRRVARILQKTHVSKPCYFFEIIFGKG